MSTQSDVIDINAEEVLQFWFGGDLHVNYKTKWFPDGSVDTQNKADSVIFKKYSEIFQLAIDNKLTHWNDNIRSTVALIIIFDQFSRHIYRLLKVSCIFKWNSNNSRTVVLLQ